jgi:ABC-type uncharacterized transport system substrate-binding protein
LIINLVTAKSLGLDTLRELEAAGPATGFQMQIVNASTSREIDTAFAAFARERPDAVFVGQDAFFNGRRLQLANWAARHGLPMTSGSRDICEVGGLMSYGSNTVDVYRQEGVYVGRILKGASRPTCRSSKPPSSSWSLTRKPRAYWASTFRPRCSPAPMR